MLQRHFLLALFCLSSLIVKCQPDGFHVIKDLEGDWMRTNAEGRYVLGEKNGNGVIHFSVYQNSYKGGLLEIKSSGIFSVYLNHTLLYLDKGLLLIDLDSLSRSHSSPWLFSISQQDNATLSTLVLGEELIDDVELAPRKGNYFLDLSIIVGLLLSFFFVMLLRSNPKHTLDYLNLARLLSLQEREDTLLNSRISSSANILYYVFISMLCAFIMLLLFNVAGEDITAAKYFVVGSLWQGVYLWIELTVLVLGLLVMKLVLISLLSNLFDSKDTIPFQFYNFIRLLFFTFGIISATTLCYFVFKIQNPQAYTFLIYGLVTMLMFWVVLIGLKLLNQSSFRSFQLFSYLCASELIPVVFIIKVLNP